MSSSFMSFLRSASPPENSFTMRAASTTPTTLSSKSPATGELSGSTYAHRALAARLSHRTASTHERCAKVMRSS